MFSRLELTNFTVFKQLVLELSPGINVLVGENATGKTHILKILYCLQTINRHNQPLIDELNAVFKPMFGDVSRLVRHGSGSIELSVKSRWNQDEWLIQFDNQNINRSTPDNASGRGAMQRHRDAEPVYISVKEPLSFAPGFISLFDKYDLPFEKTVYDTLKKACLPRIRHLDSARLEILAEIKTIIGGEVIVEGDAFYLLRNNQKMEIFLVAEGDRKLALLWQLIRTGSLGKGATLYWDEPEANLNPFRMQYVAKSLITLANHGVQIFLATHNYAFLRELEYQKVNTPVVYITLDGSGEEGVQANIGCNYRHISPNKIAEENQRLYDLEIMRAFKRSS